MINDVINKNMIFLNENMESKIEIIDYVLKEAKNKQLITETEGLKQAIIDRENQVSTAVGFKVAMPHGKSKTVNQPFISFLRTEKPFKWSDEDAEIVQMIVLIAVPEENSSNTHLKIISAVSKKLLDDQFREELLTENDIDKIYTKLLSISNQ